MKALIAATCLGALAACDSVTEPALRDCTYSQRVAQPIPSGASTQLRFDTAVCGGASAGDRITLPLGTWIVVAQVTWSPNPSGQRGAQLIKNTRDSTGVALAWAGSSPMPSTVTIQQMTAIVVSDGTAEVYVTASQSSGGTISTWALGTDSQASATYLHAARIN